MPDLVQHYAPFFTAVFSPAALPQFQRSISGLIVSENKTIEGLNRLCVIDVRNQSSLHRLLTESPCSLDAVNDARLALLDSLSGTPLKPKGGLSIDDTLWTHDGQHFDHIAYLDDAAQGWYVGAHNLVNLPDSDDHTDSPVAFRLWQPAALDVWETGLPAAGVTIRHST
jgi:hypothetical protein